MFTGLVEALGVLERRAARGRGARITVRTSLCPLVLGESIAVDGACLTVERVVSGGFEADMSAETLERTTLGELAPGAAVHLERALPAGGRLGGHLVTGHVDAVGRVVARTPVGDAERIALRAPASLARFIASKGSIAVSGVSLTVNDLRDAAEATEFSVMVVPHTRASTKLGDLAPGAAVNLEVDVLARYVARALEVGSRSAWPTEVAGHEPRASHDDDHETDPDRRLLDKLRAGGFA